jgi:lysozyme-like protein
VSDFWNPPAGAGEPDASGMGAMSKMMSAVRSMFSIKAPALDEARKQVEGVTNAIRDLETALGRMQQKQHSLASGLNSMMDSMARQARQTATALREVNGAVGNMGTGSVAVAAAPSGGGGSPGDAVAQAESANRFRQGAMNIAGVAFSGMQSNLFRDMAMFPMRFMRNIVGENRNLALQTSAMFGGQAYATGARTQDIMTALSGFPGSVYGQPAELMQLFEIARQSGAMVNLGAFAGPANRNRVQTPRAAGFLQGVRQMQAMTPGAPVPEMAATLGSYAANTQAQQQSAFLTGGAFSIIGAGGRQRSLQEWAESILRWLENMRPGSKRARPFDYGELMSQYFPGSNIDAWFQANGVPQNMREYWWNYALGKANKTGGTQGEFNVQANVDDLAYQRMKATSSITRTGFNLAGQLAGTYANREQANRWFNDVTGQVIRDVVPSAIATGPLSFVQYLPEAIEDLLFQLLERTGLGGAMVGGFLGYGGLPGAASVFANLFGGGAGQDVKGILDEILGTTGAGALTQTGDVGDVGDWGPTGGTSLAGLHPDMRKRLGIMMRANPRLKINSSLRDRATQMKLRDKGYSKVSGKPSDHTRGLAADLGPPSEYPWLVNNASRFGLRSGVSSGEPWHVGLGDPQESAGGASLIQALLGLMQGGISGEQATDVIGGMVPALMNLFLGVVGQQGAKPVKPGSAAARALQFDPGVYGRLKAAGVYRTGGLIPAFTFGGGGGAIPGSPVGGGFTGPWPSPESLQAGAAVARLASAQGFTGSDLQRMVAIAKRESGWDPSAHNPNPPDDSYGLWQINMLGTMGPSRAASLGIDPNPPYEELFDPATNARAMKMIYDSQGWNAWSTNAGVSTADLAEAKRAMDLAGVGDVDSAGYRRPVSGRGGGGVVFNNTFVINGGGGSNGIDARRTATVLADHLEDEMKRRMARRN